MRVELQRIEKSYKLPRAQVSVFDAGDELEGWEEDFIEAHRVTEEVKEDDGELDEAEGPLLPWPKKEEKTFHWLNVLSLISGKYAVGATLDADIYVYRTSIETNRPKFLLPLIATIRNRCLSGDKILQTSIGLVEASWEERVGPKDFNHVLRSMQNNGCLLVMAAGNDSHHPLYREDDPDDGLLLAHAVNPFTAQLENFSDRGELPAPGRKVMVLNPAPEYIWEEPWSRANLAQAKFVTGTSYSAPLITTVAMQVRRILLSSPRFSRLPGSIQVKLLNHILRESRWAGSVNGARAVLIAENWLKGNEHPKFTATICSQKINCTPLSCPELYRQRSLFCSNASGAQRISLALHYLKQGLLELSAKELHLLRKEQLPFYSGQSKKQYEDELSQQFSRLLKKGDYPYLDLARFIEFYQLLKNKFDLENSALENLLLKKAQAQLLEMPSGTKAKIEFSYYAYDLWIALMSSKLINQAFLKYVLTSAEISVRAQNAYLQALEKANFPVTEAMEYGLTLLIERKSNSSQELGFILNKLYVMRTALPHTDDILMAILEAPGAQNEEFMRTYVSDLSFNWSGAFPGIQRKSTFVHKILTLPFYNNSLSFALLNWMHHWAESSRSAQESSELLAALQSSLAKDYSYYKIREYLEILESVPQDHWSEKNNKEALKKMLEKFLRDRNQLEAKDILKLEGAIKALPD